MEHTRQALIAAGLRHFANEAHWFDCGSLFSVPKEVRDFGREMAARNLFEIPYDKTILWFPGAAGDDSEFAVLMDKTRVDVRKAVRLRFVQKLGEGRSGLLRFPIFILEDGDIATTPDAHATEGFAESYETLRWAIGLTMEFQGALISREVQQVRGGPSDRNRQRAIQLGREPGIIFHTLVLDQALRAEVAAAAATGTVRAAPKLHWRRGHFRDLSGGKGERLVPVAPAIVGSKAAGMVLKDYRLH